MPFPSSPTNGQTYVLNNTSYTYNSALGTWTATQAGVSTPIVIAANTAATSATTGALQVVGGIGVQGNIYTASTVVMGSPFTMRNKIINGAMTIDQRNAGASVTPTDGQYIVDRWQAALSQSSKFSVQQSTTAPSGFSNSLLVTSLSSYSVGSSDYFLLEQIIEGYNVADLSYGTSSAVSVTLSFWVRSSLTGTFGGSLMNSASNRSYPFSYTISSANTWEQKSITIAGDTTGTWLTNNGIGLRVWFNLGSGSTYSGTSGAWAAANYGAPTGATSVVGTNAATFYITGVQLEIGTAATPFEYRNYQQELAMCQRYFIQFGGDSSNDQVGAGQAFSTTAAGATVRFPVTMRGNPTLDSFTASNWSVMNGSGGLVAATAIVLAGGQTNRNGTQLSITVASGLTVGQGSSLLANTSSAKLPFNAEL